MATKPRKKKEADVVVAPEPERPKFTKDDRKFATDYVLRVHGFRIRKRKFKEEAIWEREGDLYTESEALITIPKKTLDAAQEVQERFWDSLGKP